MDLVTLCNQMNLQPAVRYKINNREMPDKPDISLCVVK